MARLESLCATSEQCTHEISQKLIRWGIDRNDAEKILSSLIQRKFVSDERYAVAFVRDKYRFSKWGRRKIMLALMQKHIDKQSINAALNEIDNEEYIEILFSVMRSKARSIREGNSFEGRTKLFRSVASRGYESSLITSFIAENEIWEND
ncbi:MAG: RecX family transcriptional regulator [Muribaculaceae bacterium]|nr:RecX family transcriptional regulator [Muribaculaceae bacterium]